MRIVLACLVALALAGCGGRLTGGGEKAKVDVTVTVWPSGLLGDSVSWDLQCEPVGGNHPDKERACAAIAAVKDPFGPLPPPARCKEIPGGGPEVALVEGRYHGRKIESRYSRKNACVYNRWDRIAPVFPTGFE